MILVGLNIWVSAQGGHYELVHVHGLRFEPISRIFESIMLTTRPMSFTYGYNTGFIILVVILSFLEVEHLLLEWTVIHHFVCKVSAGGGDEASAI
jgi:hypothetical protein